MTLFIHILPHIFIPTHNCAKNIHHFWKVLFRNDFRFINETAYSVAKYDRLENKLVLFGSLVRTTNPKCALFPHLATTVTTAAVISEPTGATATKVTLSLTTTGAAFSGRLRLKGTASQPATIQRLVRTPPQLNACFDSLWLTVIGKPQ